MTSAIGGFSGQQVQFTNTAQQNQNDQQVRSQDDNPQPRPNQVQSRGTQAAASQNTETGNQGDTFRTSEDAVLAAALANSDTGTPARGSILDVLV